MAVEQPRVKWDVLDADRPGGERDGHSDDSGFQHRRQYRRRLLPRQPESRPALVRRRRLPKPCWPRQLRLETGVLVEKGAVRGQGAVGVAFRQNWPALRGADQGDTIRSAGAVASPLILQVSGVAPGRQADRARHPDLHERPGVGRNLQDHLPAVEEIVQGPRRQASPNEHPASFVGPSRPDGRPIRPVPEGPADHGAVAARHLHEILARPRAGEHPVPRPVGGRSTSCLPLHRFPAVTVSACNPQPTPRGTIRLQGARSCGQAGHRAPLSRHARGPKASRPMRSASRAA